MDRYRIATLARLYLTLLLIFVTQKIVFILFNISLADGATLIDCLGVLWHGLRLDSVMACYLIILPAIVMLVGCFVGRLNPRRILMPYYIVAALLMALLFVADTVLYFYWGAKLDANDLMYATKPKDMLASLEWWMVVLAIAVVALLAWHYTRRLLHATPRKLMPLRGHYRWLALVALPVGGLIFLGMRGGVSESTANPSYAYFSSKSFCNHAALNPMFNTMHSLFKAQDLADEFPPIDDPESLSTIATNFSVATDITDTLLRIDHPNILLLIWESGGSGMVMNDSVGPNISSLAQEGIYFSNCVANNFRTDRGLISIIAGWQGLPTTSLMKRPDLCRNLSSLARELHHSGYHTSITYGGDIDFTGMRLYFAEAGFGRVLGGEAFPHSLHTSAWGVPDGELLRQSNLIPSERPFLSTVLTLSSHEPWDVPMHRLADVKQNAFAYTDSCIGAFVSDLRQTPLWDSLLIIILPDHGVTYGSATSSSDSRVARIPIVWVGGAVGAHRDINLLMSQSDLAATLLAQLHLPADDFIHSRNILSAAYATRQHIALHAYKNGCNLFSDYGVSGYDCISRTLISSTDTITPITTTVNLIEALLHHVYSTSAALAKP